MQTKAKLSRRTFLEVAGGTALATSLAGCFGVGGGTGSTGGGSKSTVTIWDIDTGATQTLVQNQTTAFNNSHPNIHAVIQFYENDPYKQKLQVAMGAHNPPDIFFGWGGGILKSYVDAGDVYDLTSALNADPSWKNRFLPSVFPSVTFNGKIYGVPLNNTQPIVFFYNKDIFSKAGVTPPKTWSDLLNIIPKLKQQNVIPIAVAGASQWTYLMYAEYLTDRYGGPSAFQAVLANQPNAWSQDAFIKAFTAIQQLVNAGAFGSSFSSVSADTNADAALLYTGKAAMMLQGTWNFPVFQTNSPSFIQGDKLGWFGFPTVEGGTGNAAALVGGPCNYYSISAASKSPQSAITYLKDAVLNPTAVSKWISLGDVPVVNGISQQLSSAPNSAWLEYVYQSVQNAPSFQLSWDQALPPTPANAVLTNLSELFLNKITPQQFATNMNKTIGQ